MIITQLDGVIIYNELEALVVWCSAGTCSDSAAVSKFYLMGHVALFNAIFFIVFLVYYLRGKLRPKQHLLPGFQPFFTGIPLIGVIVAIAILIFRLLIQPFQRKCRSVRYGAIHVYETLHYFITCPKWLLWNVFRLIKFLVIFLPFTSIFTFLAFGIFSIIPVILQALIYPFRVLATYSFFTANILMLYVVVFLVTFSWKRRGIGNTSIKLSFLLTIPTLAFGFNSVITIPFLSLYQLLSSGTLTNNPVMLGIISIAPSLILSSPLVWVIKNKVIPAFVEGEGEGGEGEGEGEGGEGEGQGEGEGGEGEGEGREDGGGDQLEQGRGNKSGVKEGNEVQDGVKRATGIQSGVKRGQAGVKRGTDKQGINNGKSKGDVQMSVILEDEEVSHFRENVIMNPLTILEHNTTQTTNNDHSKL